MPFHRKCIYDDVHFSTLAHFLYLFRLKIPQKQPEYQILLKCTHHPQTYPTDNPSQHPTRPPSDMITLNVASSENSPIAALAF